MSNRLIIVGAGGHGRVVADCALKNGYTDICFVDDCEVGLCMGFPIIGATAEIEVFDDGKSDFIIGIGNNSARKLIAEKHNVNWVTLIHPSAQIATNVTVDAGTVVMAGVVINIGASVGRHCIINTSAVVEHDDIIEDYVHLSPKVALGGAVHVGEGTHIGIGATVINNISVCDGCMVGAGAVVVRNIEYSATYVGVPAEEIKKTR